MSKPQTTTVKLGRQTIEQVDRLREKLQLPKSIPRSDVVRVALERIERMLNESENAA